MEKKYTCIIIDDETPARNIIREYLGEFENIQILEECNNGFDAFKKIEDLKPDFIFLDIQMPKLTGFELIEILENKPYVIFSTAYDQYAIKAFEVNAIDYLLKPYSQDRFNEAVNRIIEQIFKEEPNKVKVSNISEQIAEEDEVLNRIVVNKQHKIEILVPDDIIFLQADDDYVSIQTKIDKYLKTATLKFYEQNLSSDMFLRVHRSYIVNLNHIKNIEKFDKETYVLFMDNNMKVKTSKSGAKLLKEKLKL